MFQVGKLLYPEQQQIHAFGKKPGFFFTLKIMVILLSAYSGSKDTIMIVLKKDYQIKLNELHF